jgi:hypothetical protein
MLIVAREYHATIITLRGTPLFVAHVLPRMAIGVAGQFHGIKKIA